MKKFITKILSLVLTVVLSVGFFSGCDLVTVDTEADMGLTVATVQLEGMNKEEIKKGKLVSAFNTSGYLYVYYYGYTESEAYQTILDELVNNRIIVQQAKLSLTNATVKTLGNDKGYFILAKEATEKTNIDNYLCISNFEDKDMTAIDKNADVINFLTKYEVAKAKYNAVKTLDSYLESYKNTEDEEHNHNHETLTLTPRATLTIETEEEGNEWEIKNDAKLKVITEDYLKAFKKDLKVLGLKDEDYETKFDLSYDVYNKFVSNYDLTDKETKKALNKLLKDLKKSGFITSEEASKETPKKIDDLLKISFFESILESEYESILVNKLNLALENNEEKKINSDEKLYEEYKNLYETQKASFDKSYANYETALEGASDESFVVYNPNLGGKYGYISNLLIGFNAEQTAALDAFVEKVKGEKVAFRETLLQDLTAKDQRSTWALSNYGKYNEETGVFTFDEDYVKTSTLREYKGILNGASTFITHDEYDEEITKYNFKAVEGTEVKFDDFYTNIVSSIMGFTGDSGKLEGVEESTIVSTTINDATMDKFRDLIYAYSTDGGSLQENYGYVYSPITSKTTYVEEYAAAAEELINQGVGAYKVVATKYGYHIMLCTSVIIPGNELASKDKFLLDVDKKGTLAYKFKEYKYNLISSSTITKITNTIINTFKNDESIVVYDKSTYEDLIPKEN